MTFFDMTPPKGVIQCRGYPPENRFLEKCVYVFEDIDFWFFEMLLTLAQLAFMFSDTFGLTPLYGGKSGVTPLKISF